MLQDGVRDPVLVAFPATMSTPVGAPWTLQLHHAHMFLEAAKSCKKRFALSFLKSVKPGGFQTWLPSPPEVDSCCLLPQPRGLMGIMEAASFDWDPGINFNSCPSQLNFIKHVLASCNVSFNIYL